MCSETDYAQEKDKKTKKTKKDNRDCWDWDCWDDCLCQVLYSFQLISFTKQSPKYSKEQFIQTLPIWSFLKFRILIPKKITFLK